MLVYLPDVLRVDLRLFLTEFPRRDEDCFRRFGDFFSLSLSGMVPSLR